MVIGTNRRTLLRATAATPFLIPAAVAQPARAPWERRVVIIRVPDNARFGETYSFSTGGIELEGQLMAPPGSRSRTVYVFMHPTVLLHRLPMPIALADAGMHVLCVGSRYPSNDSALIMEKVALDLGAWVQWARSAGGYDKVVLVGWSGGGSLSLFYQAQAERPGITRTPAGDEVDLVAARLPAADGIVFIAAHMSRAEVLTEFLDPSVRSESNPDDRDPELDIYAPDGPNKPPFSRDFVTRFRAAQVARNRRITAFAEENLDRLRRRGGPEVEHAFTVHRTLCDVRWIDRDVDPNGRRPNWTVWGEPRVANTAPNGLARYTSLRSWLSQWSYDRTNTKATDNAPKVTRVPVLQVVNGADDAVPATHNPTVRGALGTPDREYVEIEGATHFYTNQPDHVRRCIEAVTDWSRRKRLLDG